MVALPGWLALEVLHGYTPTNLSADLSNFSTALLETGVSPYALGPMNSVVDVHGAAVRPAAVAAMVAHSYFDDYYNRIHLVPQSLDLGNMTSAQVHDIELWNAHLTTQLLSGVSATGNDGLSLSQPLAPPTTYQPMEYRINQLTISTNGPPIIDAAFLFSFPGETPRLVVIGRRVVLWPFIPQTSYDETLEWKTDIIKSFSNEQRIALRPAPRQSMRHTYQLDRRQFSRAKAIVTQWSHRVYGLPVWGEATFLGAVSAGVISLAFDTSNADYRDNDLVVLWETDEKCIALETTTIAAGSVGLKLPLEVGFTAAYVMPVRFARTLQPVSFDRGASEVIQAKASFQVTSNKDLGASRGYPQYRGKDVLTDAQVLIGGMSETFSRAVDQFDNGSGIVEVDPTSDWVTSRKMITFDALTRQELWSARGWLHLLRGRQLAFWLPSWNPDLEIVADIGVGETFMMVRPVGYPLYYGVTDIMVEFVSGTRLFWRVLSGVLDSVSGNEILYLEAPPGAITASSVSYISFLSHVRLDSDRVDLRHASGGRVSASVPVVETPEA